MSLNKTAGKTTLAAKNNTERREFLGQEVALKGQGNPIYTRRLFGVTIVAEGIN